MAEAVPAGGTVAEVIVAPEVGSQATISPTELLHM